MAKISKEEWEQRISDVGAGRYEFIKWAVDGEFGSDYKCVVRCHKDGYEWSSKVNNLVSGGQGCPQCSGKRRWTAEERISHINELPNILFVSWIAGYMNQYSKAKVRCSVDNYEWSAAVTDLVNGGYGCPQCGGVRKWTADERIEQINSLDNITFTMWSGECNNRYSKAVVRCGICWLEWSSSVDNLVNHGRGCPSCAKSGYDPSKTGTLYALRSECGLYLKVGISNNPSQRHRTLKLETPFSFSCIEQFEGDGTKIAELEKYFHDKYERAGFVGFDGCTEWLICTPELLEELRKLGD